MMGHKIWFYREIWLIIPTGANPFLKEATTEKGEGIMMLAELLSLKVNNSS